jgi:hypothetical protein
MDKPIRVQRKRIKDWRMPENTIYVGRSSKWGNPFYGADDFGEWLAGNRSHFKIIEDKRKWILEHIHELRGKNLACWCALDQPCHADILLKLANGEVIDEQQNHEPTD